MGTVRWRGGAADVADVRSYTFGGTWEADDTVEAVIGSKAYLFTGGSTTITTVIDTIVTDWNALDSTLYPEFAEITASRNGNDLVLTADTEGIPFICTLTPFESDGTTAADAQTIEGAGTATTGTVTTAATGGHFWSEPRNWDTGAVPVAGDDVVFDVPGWSVKYGLAQSAVTLTSLTIAASYSGDDDTAAIGLPQANEDATAYPEYRATSLAIGATTVTLGGGPGNGINRCNLNFGSVQTAVTVLATGSSPDDNTEAVLLKGTHASNVLNVDSGNVGVAIYGGETSTLATLRLDGDATVRCGSGVTLGTIAVNSGTLAINSAVGTSLTMLAGDVTIDGSGAVAQLTIRGGTCTYNTSGALGGATTVSGDGVLDFSQVATAAVTVTNPIDVYGAEAQVIDSDKRVTGGSNLIVDLNEGAAASQVDWGSHVRLTRGTPS